MEREVHEVQGLAEVLVGDVPEVGRRRGVVVGHPGDASPARRDPHPVIARAGPASPGPASGYSQLPNRRMYQVFTPWVSRQYAPSVATSHGK